MTSILRSIGFKKSKHTKLSEEWTDCQEPVKEGFTFYCRYLGSTPIEQSSNATMTSHAVKHILSMAKAKGKKLPNIALFISPTFISGTVMEDSSADDGSATTPDSKSCEVKEIKKQHDGKGKKEKDKSSKLKKGTKSVELGMKTTKENEDQLQPSLPLTPTVVQSKEAPSKQLFKISIFRIPYCFAEATYDRIVAFVSTNPNGSHECHAIIANKRKFAQAIALTISQAFDIAFNRLSKNKSPGQLQSMEQKSALGGLNSAPKQMMVATNRVSSFSNDEEDDDDDNDNGSDDSGNSSEGSEEKLPTVETFPKLTLDSFSSNSRRRTWKPNKETESFEDEKKENNENDYKSDVKLLINFDDETSKKDYSNKKPIEKPLYYIDDLRELF
ncbi:Low density lipoprotein receptor adapter protein 1 [Tyrophagus putrescentiae]|nr:Low density lipoprotein receptor adapter protein 1 [Tyrophagus putrescentiae]